VAADNSATGFVRLDEIEFLPEECFVGLFGEIEARVEATVNENGLGCFVKTASLGKELPVRFRNGGGPVVKFLGLI
jgi:hypothetical protein